MNFIDWSDAEGMIDLFQGFVRDETNGCSADTERQEFLNQLLGDVESIREGRMANAVQKLRALQDSIPSEFSEDTATTHLTDLIAELEGLR